MAKPTRGDYYPYQFTPDEDAVLEAILKHFEDGGKSAPSGVNSSDFDSLFLKVKDGWYES